MIAGRQTTLEIPGESVTITLRSLGHRRLRQAQEARREAATKAIANIDIDISKFTEAIRGNNLDAELGDSSELGLARNYAYDQDMVLEAGIVAWGYEQAVTPETIGDLDPDTAEWAFQTIIDMSRRSADERKD